MPCGYTAASVPNPTFTPAGKRFCDVLARSRQNLLAPWRASTAAYPVWAAFSISQSPSYSVGTRYVPCCFIAAIPASSMYEPCSMESTPASVAQTNALCSVRMRRYLASQTVSVGDDSRQFGLRVLRVLRIVAQRKHAAGSADLDDIGAVLDDLAHLVLHVLDAVGHADPRLHDIRRAAGCCRNGRR